MSSLWAQIFFPLLVAFLGTALGNYVDIRSILSRLSTVRRKNLLAALERKIDLHEKLASQPLLATSYFARFAAIAFWLLGLATFTGVSAAFQKGLLGAILLLTFYFSWFFFFYVVGRLADISRELGDVKKTLSELKKKQKFLSNASG